MALLKYKNQNGEYVSLPVYTVNSPQVVQDTGDSTTAVMSQNAVTQVVQNLPDNEDLMIEEDKLKLADRAYNPEEFSGKGYKILRKNIKNVIDFEQIKDYVKVQDVVNDSDIFIEDNGDGIFNGTPDKIILNTALNRIYAMSIVDNVERYYYNWSSSSEYNDSNNIPRTDKIFRYIEYLYDTYDFFVFREDRIIKYDISTGAPTKRANVLVQSDIDESDVVYEIRYDFDLGGATIELPNNSVLVFEGGSLSNGTIIGNLDFYVTGQYKCIDKSCICICKTTVPLNVLNFGLKGDDNYVNDDDWRNIMLLAYISKGATIYFPNGTYLFEQECLLKYVPRVDTKPRYLFNDSTIQNIHIIGQSKENTLLKIYAMRFGMENNSITTINVYNGRYSNAIQYNYGYVNDNKLVLRRPIDSEKFSVGDIINIYNGAHYIGQHIGESNRITDIDTEQGILYLEQPLCRDYTQESYVYSINILSEPFTQPSEGGTVTILVDTVWNNSDPRRLSFTIGKNIYSVESHTKVDGGYECVIRNIPNIGNEPAGTIIDAKHTGLPQHISKTCAPNHCSLSNISITNNTNVKTTVLLLLDSVYDIVLRNVHVYVNPNIPNDVEDNPMPYWIDAGSYIRCYDCTFSGTEQFRAQQHSRSSNRISFISCEFNYINQDNSENSICYDFINCKFNYQTTFVQGSTTTNFKFIGCTFVFNGGTMFRLDEIQGNPVTTAGYFIYRNNKFILQSATTYFNIPINNYTEFTNNYIDCNGKNISIVMLTINDKCVNAYNAVDTAITVFSNNNIVNIGKTGIGDIPLLKVNYIYQTSKYNLLQVIIRNNNFNFIPSDGSRAYTVDFINNTTKLLDIDIHDNAIYNMPVDDTLYNISTSTSTNINASNNRIIKPIVSDQLFAKAPYLHNYDNTYIIPGLSNEYNDLLRYNKLLSDNNIQLTNNTISAIQQLLSDLYKYKLNNKLIYVCPFVSANVAIPLITPSGTGIDNVNLSVNLSIVQYSDNIGIYGYSNDILSKNEKAKGCVLIRDTSEYINDGVNYSIGAYTTTGLYEPAGAMSGLLGNTVLAVREKQISLISYGTKPILSYSSGELMPGYISATIYTDRAHGYCHVKNSEPEITNYTGTVSKSTTFTIGSGTSMSGVGLSIVYLAKALTDDEHRLLHYIFNKFNKTMQRPTVDINNYEQGLRVDLPINYALPIGHTYTCIDTNEILTWDGSEWRNEDGTLVNKVTIL